MAAPGANPRCNPFPDKDRESKTWLSEASGASASLGQLLSEAATYFGFMRAEAETVAGGIAMKLTQWSGSVMRVSLIG